MESQVPEIGPWHIHWPGSDGWPKYDYPDFPAEFLVEFGTDTEDYGGFMVVGYNGYPRKVDGYQTYEPKRVANLLEAAPETARQRDELLAACRRAIEYLENCTDEPDCWCDELREGFSAPEEDLKTLNCVACQLRASIAMAESK
tara:strand:+ start:177 stop:608 length:432 start_codon:yes stop_codon:yes gene_type:complete